MGIQSCNGCRNIKFKTTELLIQKAFRSSKAVAIEGNIMNDVTTNEILAKAEREMKEVEKIVDFSKVPEPKAEEPKEEAKTRRKT